MKKIILLFIFTGISSFLNAQVVNIPDANFKNALLNHQPRIDIDYDGQYRFQKLIISQDYYI